MAESTEHKKRIKFLESGDLTAEEQGHIKQIRESTSIAPELKQLSIETIKRNGKDRRAEAVAERRGSPVLHVVEVQFLLVRQCGYLGFPLTTNHNLASSTFLQI